MLTIGEYTFIGMDCEINCKESVLIGEHVLIGPSCYITDHTHGYSKRLRIDEQICLSKPVIIDPDVWIGANVTLLSGIHIQQSAIVGAGAVVTRNVEAYTIVAGTPARVISHRSNS